MRCAKCGKEHERVTEDKPCCFDCFGRISYHIAWLAGVLVLKAMAGHPHDSAIGILDALSIYVRENRAYLDSDLVRATAWFLAQFRDEAIPATLEL